MKITEMTQVNNSFNNANIKKILIQENKFISNLWNILPIQMMQYQEEEEINSIVHATDKKKFNQRVSKERATSFKELHEKLQELKGKKSTYKESIKKKSLKKRLNKARKKEEYKKSKKVNGHGNLNKQDKNEIKPEIKPTIPDTPINVEDDKGGKIIFSKFDITDSSTSKKKKKEDPKKLLKKLENKKERIQKLEQHGNLDKAKEIREKAAWEAALKKAAGEKVKDNPELLKKTIRATQDKKRRSKKKWEAREEMVQKKIDDRQKKRTESIQKRKSKVKLNKMKKASDKGRYIPGFSKST